MKIENAPDALIIGVGRLVGADREVTGRNGAFEGEAEILQGPDFHFVDFLDHRPHLDTGQIRGSPADHFEDYHPFRFLQLQFFTYLFIDRSDHDTEFFADLEASSSVISPSVVALTGAGEKL